MAPDNDGGQPSEVGALAAVIFRLQPIVALDVFVLGETAMSSWRLEWSIGGLDSDDMADDDRPIAAAPEATLKAWVDIDPLVRAPRLARHIAYFRVDGEAMRWTPMALWLLEHSGAEARVAETLERRFHEGTWSGSAASRYERRMGLVDVLLDHPNPIISAWARELKNKLASWIAERDKADRAEAERFE
jgi:hypothetical protein